MNNNLLLSFTTLREKYGSHCEVAKNIGVSSGHYRKIRNGRAKIPKRTENYIILKALELESNKSSLELSKPVTTYENIGYD